MSYKNQTNELFKQFQDAVNINTDFDTLILNLDTVFTELLHKAISAKNEACLELDTILARCFIKDHFKFTPSTIYYTDLFSPKNKEKLYNICENKLDKINPEIAKLELDIDHNWFKDLDNFFVSDELNSLYHLKEQVELLQESINYA